MAIKLPSFTFDVVAFMKKNDRPYFRVFHMRDSDFADAENIAYELLADELKQGAVILHINARNFAFVKWDFVELKKLPDDHAFD